MSIRQACFGGQQLTSCLEEYILAERDTGHLAIRIGNCDRPTAPTSTFSSY